MKPRLILISGKAGVGKGFTACCIKELLDRKYTVIEESFAKSVKEAAKVFFQWDGEKDIKGRELLQSIGKIGRKYAIDLWASSFCARVKKFYGYLKLSGTVLFVVSDARFPNEIQYTRDCNQFSSVTVLRIEAPERESLKETPAYYDESETALPSANDKDAVKYYDYVIDNSGTKEELLQKLQIILRDERFL